MRLLVLLVAIIMCGENASSEVGNYYYKRTGERVYLPLADSLVFVKLVPDYANMAGQQFATTKEVLNGEYEHIPSAGEFYIYKLAPDYHLENSLAVLRQSEEVAIANPVIAEPGQIPNILYITDEFIVMFKEDVTLTSIDSLNNANHVEVLAVDPDFITQYLLRITSETESDLLSVTQAYWESDLCLFSTPNIMGNLQYSAIPDDPYFSDQWNLRNTGQDGGIADADIDADSAWEVYSGTGSSTIIVAVIDGGFELGHEDLNDAQVFWKYDAGGNVLAERTPDDDPSNYCTSAALQCWHATAVAGAIFAELNNQTGLAGLVPQCKFMPIKVTDNLNQTDSWSICGAFRHMRGPAHKAHIASCSWCLSPLWPTEPIEYALDTAYHAGISVFFASGNETYVAYPAASPWVTAVGATNRRDSIWVDDEITGSGQGDSLDIVCPGAGMPILDLMGAVGYNSGTDTCNLDWSYICRADGTSLACPQAAGIAAAVLSRRWSDFRYLSSTGRVDTLRWILYESAEDQINPADPEGWDATYGHGRVNAYRALLSVIRGDVNNDGVLAPLDVTCLVNFVFRGWDVPPQPEYCVGDCNCDGSVSPMDVVYLANKIYRNYELVICFDYMED